MKVSKACPNAENAAAQVVAAAETDVQAAAVAEIVTPIDVLALVEVEAKTGAGLSAWLCVGCEGQAWRRPDVNLWGVIVEEVALLMLSISHKVLVDVA